MVSDTSAMLAAPLFVCKYFRDVFTLCSMGEGKMYTEGMPITTLLEIHGNILVAGGGGNVLFGFPNRVTLMTPGRRILAEKNVKNLVVNAKAYENLVILEYEEGYEMLLVRSGSIAGPFSLPEGIASPVVAGSSLYYVREGKIFSASVAAYATEEEEKAAESSLEQTLVEEEYTPGQPLLDGDRITSLIYCKDGGLCILGERDGERFLLRNESMHLLDSKVTNYTGEREFGYVCQLPEGRSPVTMFGRGKRKVIEEKGIAIQSLGNGRFLVGTGDGYLVLYREGVEVFRKKVLPSPVSSIVVIDNTAHCSSINGRLRSIRLPSSGLFLYAALFTLLAAGGLAYFKSACALSSWSAYLKAEWLRFSMDK